MSNILPKQTIRTMFATLLMAGCRPPETWATLDREHAVSLWQTLLGDTNSDQLTKAVLAYLRTPEAKWWPTAGALLTLLPERQLEDIDDSDEAWSQTLRMIRRYGRVNKPEQYHDNPVKHARIKAGIGACGGWSALCLANTDSLMTHRASFRAAYRSAKLRYTKTQEIKAIENIFPMHKLIGEIGK